MSGDSALRSLSPPILTDESLLKLIGWNMIGFILSAIILGVLSVQTYLYFKRFHDNLLTRGIVIIMVMTQYGTLLAQSQATYYGLVMNFGNLLPMVELLATRSTVYFTVGILQSCIVQLFFTARIHNLSRNWWITSSVFFTVLAQIGLGLALIVEWNGDKGADVLSGRLYVIFIAWVVSEIIADVCIAGVLSTLLWTRKCRSDMATTNTLLTKLIMYTVSTGGITAACSFITAISIFIKDPPLLGLIGQPYAGVFPLAMLANLHSRTRVRQWEQTMRSGNRVHVSSGGRLAHMRAGKTTSPPGIEMGPVRSFLSFGRRSTNAQHRRESDGVIVDVVRTEYTQQDSFLTDPSTAHYPTSPIR